MVAVRNRALLIGGLSVFLLYKYSSLETQLIISPKQSSACHDSGVGSDPQRSFYPEFDEVEGVEGGKYNKPYVAHIAKFGLGHRLGRIGSAWHLAKSLNVTRLALQWSDCEGMGNIFPKLFGSDFIDVPDSEVLAAEENTTGYGHKHIKIRNDVDGYYGGHNYKRHKVPLSAEVYKGENSPWLQKLESDLQLYKILRRTFAYKEDVIRFMEEHNFRDHFVVGLHLRLGNDEPSFESQGRVVDDQRELVYNMLDMLRSFLDSLRQSHPERFVNCQGGTKTPLIFLATDSPKFIPFIVEETSLMGLGARTVVMEQLRVDEGVTFSKLKQGKKCLQGWREMIQDAMLLSFSDVLISPRYSTFAQILPLPLVFDRGASVPGPHFCEMSDSARTMVCLEDMRTWIFRDDKEKIFRYSILQGDETEPPFVHRILVLLPDVEVSPDYAKVKSYLENGMLWNMTYGSQFSPKYRWKLSCPDCTEFHFT